MVIRTHRNALPPGHQLHWYRIDGILGQGGFGITYLAYDLNLHRRVAIKEYLPVEIALREEAISIHPISSKRDEEYRWGLERFIAEARMLAKFQHPNIVKVLNVFEANNTAYMVMGYEDGESFYDVLKRRKTLEEAELLMVLRPIADGLQKIHQSGFIHRDIKPANIFIRKDRSPVLLDFGSARHSVGEHTRTMTRILSPGYAPIEQYYGEGEEQGPWTDIYGLAATLYRGIAGDAPMDALARSQGILRTARDPLVPAVRVGGSRYSERFLKALDRALSFQPRERPQTLAEWGREVSLTPLTSGEDVAEPTVVRITEPRPLAGEHNWRNEYAGRQRVLRQQAAAPAAAWRWGILTVLCAALFGVGLLVWLENDRLLTTPGEMSAQPKTPIRRTAQSLTPKSEAVTSPSELRVSAEKKLAALLKGAEEDITAGHLTSPQGANAFEKYQTVLRFRPNDREATEGIERIASRVIEHARAAMQGGDWGKAYGQLDEAAKIAPGYGAIGSLREEVNARQSEARLAMEQDAKLKEAERTLERLLELAEQAMQRGDLGIARSYVDRASTTLPRHRAIAPVREALEKRARATTVRPPLARETSEGKRVNRFIELAIRSMDDADLDLAQHYVDQAATIRPKDPDVILLRDELISRKAQGQQENKPDPAGVDHPNAGGGAVLGRNHIAVQIQNARSSLSTARPGDTVEFFTQYSLTLPPGRRAEYVEATWILIRNGKKLGEEGVVGGMFQAGQNSAANRLTLPRRIMPGEYAVEHRVRSGTSYDTARSDFSVVRD
ncbi:MAG: protein kinase domain-containing protein [Gammaproteobacteria bacterium]